MSKFTSEKMTYHQAKKLKNEMDDAWDSYYENCGKPTLDGFENCVKNAPENVFNCNKITRTNGVMVTGENNKRVFEYPSGLLAWGFDIPSEAYVSDAELNNDIWSVVSIKETFDW